MRNSTILSLLTLFCLSFQNSEAFLFTSKVTTQAKHQSSLQSDRKAFASKLLPVYDEDELADIFKEFNITNFDYRNDPELAKWQPSKEFFEKFGFQNNTERYKRKVADVKTDFYSTYTTPILPQYKTFIADLLAVTYIQIIDSRFEYDALHAFGLCTQYYTIMKGYPLQDEVRISNFTSKYPWIEVFHRLTWFSTSIRRQ